MGVILELSDTPHGMLNEVAVSPCLNFFRLNVGCHRGGLTAGSTMAAWRDQQGGGGALASPAGSAGTAWGGSGRQKAAEGASKLSVEDGVDDRVEEAVDVAEPDEEREECRMDVTERTRVDIVADADGVDDVEREERKPARQKHACTHTHTHTHTGKVRIPLTSTSRKQVLSRCSISPITSAIIKLIRGIN